MDLSVLTPVFNEEAHIRETVGAMRSQTFDGELEFIFIDGRSTDRSREILEELAAEDDRIRVIDNPARKITPALNLGLGTAQGRLIARMDAHTIYPPDYLERGAERLARGDVAHVSGPQLPRPRGRWSRRVALALSTRLGIGGAAFRVEGDREREVDSGFLGIWRRDTLEELNGWDERWPINEDGELAARIRATGGRLVCLPEMAAGYVPRDSLRSLGRQYFAYGFWRAKTVRRHPHAMRRSHALPPALTLAMVAALLGVPRLRKPARLVVAAYGVAVLGTMAGLRRDAEPADLLALPAVLATMHLSWGAGFLLGCLRHGPPWQALAGVLRP